MRHGRALVSGVAGTRPGDDHHLKSNVLTGDPKGPVGCGLLAHLDALRFRFERALESRRRDDPSFAVADVLYVYGTRPADDAVREILRIVYAQQYETAGDWPQWFMLDPYRGIRDPHSHGDVIVWPLKALCDYLEATGDFGFLDEPIAWTADDFSLTAHRSRLAAHVEKQLATIAERFIPGTHLIRYGHGDWNDALPLIGNGVEQAIEKASRRRVL